MNCCFSLVLPVDHALANNFDAATMSAIGPKQICASALHMSAFGGKADMKHTSRDFGIGAFGALEYSLVIEVIGWLDA